VHAQLLAARDRGEQEFQCSLDLGRSQARVRILASAWEWDGRPFPYPDNCRARTIYYWSGQAFLPVARFTSSLIKLIPTPWGPPTFEIDGIKMLPTERLSPFEDARLKVASIEPRGKSILDTCGGLGYFAHWCLLGEAVRVLSFEKSADVMWLRTLNPWSPAGGDRLNLIPGDVCELIGNVPDGSIDAVLHDPPRFGIAGELYSQSFYDALARVLRRNGRLFHYTGAPNRLTSGRDVPGEVSRRLSKAGFTVQPRGDGVLAHKRSK